MSSNLALHIKSWHNIGNKDRSLYSGNLPSHCRVSMSPNSKFWLYDKKSRKIKTQIWKKVLKSWEGAKLAPFTHGVSMSPRIDGQRMKNENTLVHSYSQKTKQNVTLSEKITSKLQCLNIPLVVWTVNDVCWRAITKYTICQYSKGNSFRHAPFRYMTCLNGCDQAGEWW